MSIVEKEINVENHKVLGMTCAACAISLESHLKEIPGLRKVSVNYPNQSLAIEYDSEEISVELIQAKAKEIGYDVLLGSEDEIKETFEQSEEERLSLLKKKLLFSAFFTIPIFVISMFFMGKFQNQNWILLMLSIPVLFWSGSEFFIIAWKKLKHFSANMDTLVALSTGVAFGFSVFNTVLPNFFISRGMVPHVYFESAVVIITLILFGRFLEEKAKSKTSSAIKKLMGMKPNSVIAIRNGEEVVIPYGEINRGELIVIRPGDKIPVDGKVKKGDSFIDESMITGEPIPVHKVKREFVYAGTINQKGSLRILAQKVGKETLLSQIIQMVEQAQSSKPAIQKLADKIAGIFVPTVIFISIISFITWYYFGPEPYFSHAIVILITVLIVACPCALGLATPTALMVGIGKGAEMGILIKDAQVLETAYKIDTLVLDKTGTITEGKPSVTNAYWQTGQGLDQWKGILLAIELQSEHPIADAVVTYLKDEKLVKCEVEGFESITGKGAYAKKDNFVYRIGNEGLMLENGVEISELFLEKARIWKQQAKTVLYFSKNDEVVGLLAVTDKIKEGVKKVIEGLKKSGVDVHMITGDNEETAREVASRTGINHFQANVLPIDKMDFILNLQNKGKVVAMAGDGINDSAALAQSDVGIAMGTGTDIAMESAGITLMNSNLSQISKAINLSKYTMLTIKQNLFWAFFYNIIAIPIAAGILYPFFGFLLSPMIAGAAMSMSSISVLLNSLRLKRKTVN